MIFFDTETCGLHGPIVIIQYAVDDGEIVLHNVWTSPIHETLAIVQLFCDNTVVGFNLAFDWFHICQTATVLELLGQEVGYDALPEDHIEAYARLEPLGRDGKCYKPVSAFDIMLHARKGPYQSTMDRKDIRIRRVPYVLAAPLAQELDRRIPLDDLYFARASDKSKRWTVADTKELDGTASPDFADVVLKFRASAALKVLAVDALGLDKTTLFDEISPPGRPLEYGFAPFALAISDGSNNWRAEIKVGKNKGKTGNAWPALIRGHISHWAYNPMAREYATNDVVYTRDLYYHFGSPPVGDNDSILACMVGAVRWRGFAFDVEAIKDLRRKALVLSVMAPKSPSKTWLYISKHLSDDEKSMLKSKHGGSTKRTVLEELEKWEDHPVAQAAAECLNARKATKEIELYDKLLIAGRFHTSLKVIGTLSSRMSGADGLNPQGIKHDKYVRQCFPLAFGDLLLCGGDFAGFEVAIADAVYDDPELRKQLCTCSVCGYVCTLEEFSADEPACPKCGAFTTKCCKTGQTGSLITESNCVKCGRDLRSLPREDTRRKIHGLFAMELFPGETYDDVLGTKGGADDHYDKGKRGIFSQLYGGNEQTLVNKLGVELEVAQKAQKGFADRFKGVGLARDRISEMFCSMRQPGGIGKAVEWHDPSDYIETVNGFRRYFTLENQICKALFTLANKCPPPWKNMKITVRRRDRDQFVGGATMSALYGAAFQIQASNLRAAANHVIQSTGALLTKDLQCKLWELQPIGANDWVIQPLNIHDELMCPTQPDVRPQVTSVVKSFVTANRHLVPLLKIDWSETMNNWSEK